MSNYWQDRMAAAQTALSNKSIKQVETQLRKYYLTAAKRCIADFESTYNKILATQAEGKQPTPADLYKLDKYWKAQGQLKQELQKLGNKTIKYLSVMFEYNFFEVYYGIALQGSKSFNTVSKEAAKILINSVWVADGKTWSERIWGNIDKLADTLNEGLVHCVITGKKTTELKKILQERFNVSYHRADSLVRTEIAHIQTEAAKQRYKDYGIAKVQFWADPDERTCPECGKLHKKIYSVNDQIPIPAHPNCRCCAIPVVEDNE